MADYNPTPWDYEQQQIDEPTVTTAPVPTPEPGMVTIGQEDWRTGGPGPVPIPEGQGIRLTGGLPFKPEGPLPWWTIAYEQEKKRMADEARIQEMLRTVPVMQREKALERANRLEGNLAFQADLQSGMSPQQALLKNAPKLFYNSPAAMSSVLRAGSRPDEVSPYTLGETIPVDGGQVVVVGPRSGQYVPSKVERTVSPDRQLNVINATIKSLTDESEMADEARKAEIAADLIQLRRQQRTLSKALTERPSASPTTGKSAPAIGTVVKGYRFKGGDPSKKDSWEKVS